MKDSIRRARRDDAPRLVELSAQARRALSQYQPIFWRMAADADERQLSFFGGLLERGEVLAFVYEDGATIRGFIIASTLAAPVYDPGVSPASSTTLWSRRGRGAARV